MKNKKKYVSNLITRILLLIIFLLFILIMNKYNKSLTLKIKNEIFNKSLNFIKINMISKKILGKDVFYYQDNQDSLEVMSQNFNEAPKENYLDGQKLKVTSNLPIGSIHSGVVVFIGNKDNYGDTIIIQGTDGFNIWYGNIKDVNVGIYDYIDENSLLGSANGDYVYLVIEKNNKYYTYEEYSQNKD